MATPTAQNSLGLKMHNTNVAQDTSAYYSVVSTYCATLLLEITLLQSNNNFENVGQDLSVYYSVWF